MTDDAEDQTIYQVVINDEEQYSIWPADRDLPAGWRPDGTTGRKAECLAHIDEVWTDMRPLSLRKYMEEQERAPAEPEPGSRVSRGGGGSKLPNLVRFANQIRHYRLALGLPDIL